MFSTLPATLLLLASQILLSTNALPAPTPNTRRAGGPTAVPIPPTCTITNLAPTYGTMKNQTYIPATDALDNLLYSAYYPSPSTNTTTLSLQCLQQCHGYGNTTQCKSAFWAEKMVVPHGYYGSSGRNLKTACLLFDRTLQDDDFVVAPEGQASNVFAWSLTC